MLYSYDAFGRIVQQQHIRRTVEQLSQLFIARPNTQTFSLVDPSSQLITQSSTLTFAHDGHGSVRALFGAAAAIAQVYTYSAYGELLAIHNGSGLLTPNTSALTAYLYNGEGLDARTGLYNMRARWYSASNARWERLDPFNGNPSDPFSFNKYGFVHGDPVQGIAPTGMVFRVGGFFSASAISGAMRGMNQFAVYAGRQTAIAGIETGMEVAIGNLIAAATGISFDNNLDDISRTFATNAASNIATAGIGNKTRHAILLRNMLDFAVRMVSDVAIGGENIMWAAAVNLMSFGA
ncbi:MAG: RHS repeat-associated core domain-containing protein, partial [Planctomycetota bacterium]